MVYYNKIFMIFVILIYILWYSVTYYDYIREFGYGRRGFRFLIRAREHGSPAARAISDEQLKY